MTKSPEAYAKTRPQHREAAYEAMIAAGRVRWSVGDHVRHYRARGGAQVRLPGDDDARSVGEAPRDYDVEHYIGVLVDSFASRLRKAFTTEDFGRLFQRGPQIELFARPVAGIEVLRIRCPARAR